MLLMTDIETASLKDDIQQFFHQRRTDIVPSEAYTKARDEFDVHFETLQDKLAGDPDLVLAIESNVWEIAAACEDSAYNQGFKDGVNFLMQFIAAGKVDNG